MTRPNIQIEDEVREMTEEEYANHEAMVAEIPKLAGADDLA